MPLKASLVAVLAAASSVHAVVVARAGMPVMCAEQAKQKWLAKNAGKLGFGFAEVAPKNGVAAPAAPTGPDVSSAAEDLNLVLAGQTARSETLECSATPNTLELDSRLEDMRQERAKLSRSIAAAEAEKGTRGLRQLDPNTREDGDGNLSLSRLWRSPLASQPRSAKRWPL